MLFMILEVIRGFLMPFPFWIRRLGPRGEYLARRYFHRRGYHLLARNWRQGRWELDAIMANPKRVVFLEVKTRKWRENLHIDQVLSLEQEQRLKHLARAYIRQMGGDVPWSLVLILITFNEKRRISIKRMSL